MYEHFKNIEHLYGNAGVRLPNNVFVDLSSHIKSKSYRTNIQQVAFAYSYLVVVSLLYKYVQFVDVDNNTYIQNSDIKELLGYNRSTKSIDRVIKRGGVLDQLGLTSTTKDYPVRFEINHSEKINEVSIREFTTINDLEEDDVNYNLYRSVVKNRNFEIKEPLFLTSSYEESDYGTLYSIERTHLITVQEFLKLRFDPEINNIDFMMYAYFKSKCRGFDDNTRSMSLNRIVLELGIDKKTFYNHLNILKNKGYISVNHKGWRMADGDFESMESNEYCFKGC